MRKILVVLVICCICLPILGCQSLDETKKKENQLSEEDLYDIYLLFRAPKATEKNDLSELIKLVFTDSDSPTGNTIAIDVKENIIHINPWTSTLGVTSLGESGYIEDIDSVLNIVERYNVQDWKEDYSFEDPSTFEDGYGWNL